MTAAAKLGWGEPDAGDEFTGTAVDTRRWGMYDGPGHAGNGRRSPRAFTVADGLLTVTGLPDGTTGGMAWQDGQRYGRWETRMRVPRGDAQYSAVALLWPDAENWPAGGEVDFFETRTQAGGTNFFLHYGASNRQTQAGRKLDITQWHHYAVEWTSKCIVGYIDGGEWFRDCDPSHLPPGPMHLCLQLDWFPNGRTAAQSSMQVDWVRIWN